MNLDDLVRKKKLTQTEFAALVDVNQSTISKALTEGILTEGADWITWNRELLRHSMEVSAGRKGDGPWDLTEQRARLAAAQAEKVEIELDVLRHKLWPVGPIAEVIEWHTTNFKTKMLGLPYRFKSIAPSIAPKEVDQLDNLIREALTDLGQQRLPRRFVEMAKQYFIERHSQAKHTAKSPLERDQPNGRTRKRAPKKTTRDQKRGPAQNPEDVAGFNGTHAPGS